MLDRHLHPGDSENRKHSQNWREKQAVEDMGNVNVTFSVRDSHCSGRDSNFPEHSQNSLLNGKPKVGTEQANMSCSDCDGQCLAMASKFRELSPNSRMETECSEGTQQKQNTKLACTSEPNEYSQDSLGGVGSNVSVPRFSWFKSMSQIVGLTATWQQDKVEGNPMGVNTASNAKTNPNPVHTEFNFFL